jgi:hypothetical protein
MQELQELFENLFHGRTFRFKPNECEEAPQGSRRRRSLAHLLSGVPIEYRKSAAPVASLGTRRHSRRSDLMRGGNSRASKQAQERTHIMRWISSSLAFVLALSAPAVFAQTTKPDVSAAPSAQNSGAGIAGQPGGKSGPAAPRRDTVGSGVSTNPQNPTVQQQDTSKIKGMPGNKSGPPAQ